MTQTKLDNLTWKKMSINKEEATQALKKQYEKKIINIDGEISVANMIYVKETYGMKALDNLLMSRAKYKLGLLIGETNEWTYSQNK